MKITMEQTKMLKMFTEGVSKRFEDALKKELQVKANTVVEQAAKHLALNIAGNIHAYTDIGADQIIVTLSFDGVKKTLEEL